jgi:glutamyl-tRNA synthetase
VSSPVRVRFAPSPTGLFHVGSARSALFNWLFVRQRAGVFVLRIEDTDEARNRPEWTDGILSAMTWLGLDWDEGPYFQSERAPRHAEAGAKLLAGGHAYYCDCTAEARDARARARGGAPGYDGYCRDRGLEAAPGRAVRFRVPEGRTVVHDVIRGEVQVDNATIEDFVIQKGNGGAIFYLANTVDDLDMAITHVIRGEEHLPNTPKGLLLWAALGGGLPPTYAHLPLLVNEQRKKLSKRRDKVALESYRDEGYLADAMRNYLCLLGWSPGDDRELLGVDEMIAEFRLEEVNNSPAFFDIKKLTAFNERYIQAMDLDTFVVACQPFLARAPWRPADFDGDVFARMALPVKERTKTLADVPGMVDFLFLPSAPIDPASWEKGVAKVAAAPDILDEALAAYAECPWDAQTLHDRLQEAGERHGLALGKAQAPIRVAVTGRTVGPPLFESLEVLGRERTLVRLAAARSRLGG